MQAINEVRLEFPSHSCNEAFARSCASCFAAQLDPTLEELGDLKTAVSEAVTNAIVHAYPGRTGPVAMKLRLLEGNVVEITVEDKGCGIEDIPRAMEPMVTTGGAERSGMGFSIMACFTDSLRVRSTPGRGTTVVMRKKLSGRPEP